MTAKRDQDTGGAVRVVVAGLLIIFLFYVYVDSHYDQADHSEIKILQQRIEALEQKIRQP